MHLYFINKIKIKTFTALFRIALNFTAPLNSEHFLKFISRSKLATIRYEHFLGGRATLTAIGLDLLDHVHALDHLAERHMLAVEPRARHRGDKELRAVGVWPRVGHGHQAGPVVLDCEILVRELALLVDRLAAGAVVAREIAALQHKARHDPMKGGALVAKAFFTCAQSAKVFCAV